MKKETIAAFVVIGIFVLFVVILLLSNGNQAITTGNAIKTETVETGVMHNVTIHGFTFSPTPLQINVGDTIVWNNIDSVGHTVTSDFGNELNSTIIPPGSSYSHTFTTAGTYQYHCSLYPYMKGIINVQ